MRRISLVLSTLSVAIAFSAVLLAIGESQVSAAGVYPNTSCAMTPGVGFMSDCACEVSPANGGNRWACSTSFASSVIHYYCLGPATTGCLLGGTDCGQKYDCQPPQPNSPHTQCNSPNRVCGPTGILCLPSTTTGCKNVP